MLNRSRVGLVLALFGITLVLLPLPWVPPWVYGRLGLLAAFTHHAVFFVVGVAAFVLGLGMILWRKIV